MAMAVAGFTGGQAEDLRRAMGFKRSEKRMKQLEGLLREGMAKNGITGATADRIVLSITSFALYGFPESHAASFALIAYASAYLKVHYPAAFYTALLNNQPMGFYHPATLVKDAQRRGVRFAPDRRAGVRLGLHGGGGRHRAPRVALRRAACARKWGRPSRRAVGRREAGSGAGQGKRQKAGRTSATCALSQVRMRRCVDDRGGRRQRESPRVDESETRVVLQRLFAQWADAAPLRRFRSVDELVRVVGLRRDEVTALAEIGALNSFGMDRRSALWQAERAVRPSGELFEDGSEAPAIVKTNHQIAQCRAISRQSPISNHQSATSPIANRRRRISRQ